MNQNELMHYGIAGQKWGKRNGPPYPLKESAKSSAEKKGGYNVKARDVKKNMDNMTDAELQRAINRINMQNQVNKMNPSITQKGYDQLMKNAKIFTATVGTAAAVVKAWTLLSPK